MIKVLILDDDQALSEAVRLTLSDKNIEADCASCAVQATTMVEKNDYDMVLLDYAMPEHDGIWFMQNANIPPQTKVLLITGYLHRNLINKMFDLGACGYMIKPFDDEDLLHNVEFFLSDRLNGKLSHMASAP